MSHLTPENWKRLVRIFKRLGFEIERETDDHIVMSKAGVLRPLIIPKYKQVGKDIILNNIRSAGISRETYMEHREKT